MMMLFLPVGAGIYGQPSFGTSSGKATVADPGVGCAAIAKVEQAGTGDLPQQSRRKNGT